MGRGQWSRWDRGMCEGCSLEIGMAFYGRAVRRERSSDPPTWAASMNSTALGAGIYDAPSRRTSRNKHGAGAARLGLYRARFTTRSGPSSNNKCAPRNRICNMRVSKKVRQFINPTTVTAAPRVVRMMRNSLLFPQAKIKQVRLQARYLLTPLLSKALETAERRYLQTLACRMAIRWPRQTELVPQPQLRRSLHRSTVSRAPQLSR
jgi:hypothetical protein